LEKDLIDIKDYEYLVGKPYKKKCFDGTGFDCWTLIHHVYSVNNIELPKNILEGWSIRKIHEEFKAHKVDWLPVDFSDRKFLDVLLFHTSYRLMTHVGLVLNKKYFIHAHHKKNVVIEKFSNSIAASRIHKVYRWQY